MGISILKEYWGLGLGKALSEACILCAKEAGTAVTQIILKKIYPSAFQAWSQTSSQRQFLRA